MKSFLLIQLFLLATLGFLPYQMQETLEGEVEREGYGRKERIEFENWMMEHGRNYDNDFTLTHRFQIFMRNMKSAEQHNKISTLNKWGLNAFSDMEPEELKSFLFMHQDYDEKSQVLPQFTLFSRQQLRQLDNHPILVDMRNKAKTSEGIDWTQQVQQINNQTPKVAQQGMCGSCWAFSSSDVSISRLALKGKANLGALSKTHLIDCSRDSCGGCNGGSAMSSYKYINANGGLYEKDYRMYDEYQEEQQNCGQPVGNVGKGDFAEYVAVDDPSVEQIQEGLESGPVVALMYTDQSWFQFSSGVIDTCGYEKDKKNSHAVVIVGHTKKNWIIKNSWGTEWGDAGFFKVTMRGEANCVDKIKRISYPKVN